MATPEEQRIYRTRRYLFYWVAFTCSYIFPFAYFAIKTGITQSTTKLAMPIMVVLILSVLKLGGDLPKWTATWEPSVGKGLLRAIPKFLMFIVLITLGVFLKYIIERQVVIAFFTYFETVLVLFGGMCAGAIFEAYHLKYKELFLLSKGYVLGVVNKQV